MTKKKNIEIAEQYSQALVLVKQKKINESQKILENIMDPANEGLHLLYSHFRTMEGIGILRLVFLANGMAEFKIKRDGNKWILDIKEEDIDKPTFVLYTGTETPEEKEIIHNVYND